MLKPDYNKAEAGGIALLKRAGKAVLISVSFTVLVFAVFSLLLTTTELSERMIPAVVLVTMIISVIIAGFLMTRNTGSKGMLKGAGCGLCYVVILYFIAALASQDFAVNTYVLIMLGVGVIAGAFGGILGVNSGGKRR